MSVMTKTTWIIFFKKISKNFENILKNFGPRAEMYRHFGPRAEMYQHFGPRAKIFEKFPP